MSSLNMGSGEAAPWVPVVLSLARELWVLRDRYRVMEEILTARGQLPPGSIDSHEPSPEAHAAIDRECRAFVEGLIAAMHQKSGT
jgi:hypothetical protein